MLDLIYDRSWPIYLDPITQEVFHWETSQQSSAAVRERRRFAGLLLDEVSRREDACVLSVASGHLREFEVSAGAKNGAFKQFIALDQDEETITELRRCRYPGVSAVCDGIRSIVNGKRFASDRFDLIYSLGLYDYLTTSVATRLTSILAGCLRSPGKFIAANFHSASRDAGGLECMMDWWLTYRDEEAVLALGDGLDNTEFSKRVFVDATGALVYLQIERH